MPIRHKPDGDSTASPCLIVDGADHTIAFLQRGFGTVQVRRFPGTDRRLLHAGARVA